MIEINQELCIGCGACIKDCPGRAIKMEEGKAVYKRDCIHCGHCVAVCPVKAVSIPEYDMADVEEYDPDTFTVKPENFLHLVKFRRSIRDFKPEPIAAEKFERIINAGRYSATAKNTQGCKFIIVKDRLEEFKELVWQEMPKVIEVLKEKIPDYARAFEVFYVRHQRDPKIDTFFFNTTSFLVIATDNPWDGGLAAANIENMAVAEGAGALYSGYMLQVVNASPVLREWLGIPELPASCCMLLGYPNVRYRRTAPRRAGNIDWR